MIKPLAQLGAYFSFPGYYAHPRKERQRETFRHVPFDRLLIETDAPDQLPPETCIRHPLMDRAGQPINHPANLRAIYEAAAEMVREPLERVCGQVEANFCRLFA
jgi:TatD DNase family protein